MLFRKFKISLLLLVMVSQEIFCEKSFLNKNVIVNLLLYDLTGILFTHMFD